MAAMKGTDQMNSEDFTHEELLFRFLITMSGIPAPEPMGKGVHP